MRKIPILITIWEKGDRVLTYEGTGTVLEDEEECTNPYYRGSVRVKLDEPTSRYTSGYADLDPEHFMVCDD